MKLQHTTNRSLSDWIFSLNLGACLLGLSILVSCSGNQLSTSLHGGTVQQQNFYEVLPFDYKRNEIFITARINGVEGSFIVDTGAPNVLTKQFQQKLKIKSKFSRPVGDSRNQKERRDFAIVDKVELGSLTFEDHIAVIADFEKSPEIGCFGVDGFIGANLMRKAYWQIDYLKQTLVITDQYEKLGDLSTGVRLPFEERTQGTPMIQGNLGNRIKAKFKLDTGSAGGLSLNARHLKKLKAPFYAYLGYTSSGLSGATIDTTFYFEAPEIWLGELQSKTQLIKGDRNASNLIGNRFLDDFLVTIDWVRNELILIPQEEKIPTPRESFGFSVRYGRENLVISGVIAGSLAQQQGLQAEDIVLEIDQVDFRKLPYEEYCQKSMGDGFLPQSNQVQIKVQRKSSGEVVEVKLEKYDPLSR